MLAPANAASVKTKVIEIVGLVEISLCTTPVSVKSVVIVLAPS
jgi:hypothetical protein